MSTEQEIQKALEFQDELPPIPRPAPVLKAPPIRQEILSLEARMIRLENLLTRSLEQQQQRQPAPSSALSEMAATWAMFNQIQGQAQDSVQKNYLFTRQLAEDIAAGKSTAGENSETATIFQALQALPQLLQLLPKQEAPPSPPATPSPAPIVPAGAGVPAEKSTKPEVVK